MSDGVAGSKSYSVGLAGTSHYQSAIRLATVGSKVRLKLKSDNPYDEEAIAVETSRGKKLGYVPKDSFLRDAIHVRQSRVAAVIHSIGDGGGGYLGVVVSVTLDVSARDDVVYEGEFET